MVGKMTREEFNMVFKLLCTNYPNTKNQKEMGDLYFLALEYELTRKEFLAVALEIIKTSKSGFMPQIAEIFERANKTFDIETQVIQAKKLLKYGIAKCGRTGNTCFEDKGIHAVIEAVGWLNLCNMDDKESSNFYNFQFDGIYKGFYKNPYETQDYYRGQSQIYGREEPRMLTYEMLGLTTGNMNLIQVEYNHRTEVKRLDTSEARKKMLIGG